jgi:transcriptional regulator with XRE-family HTH domain
LKVAQQVKTVQEEGPLNSGDRLERLLYELRMTQTELARQTEKSPQYVNNIIRQGQGITEDYARKLGETTGVNLNWLLVGVGPMLRCDVTAVKGEVAEGHSPVGLIKRASQMLQQAADDIGMGGEEHFAAGEM